MDSSDSDGPAYFWGKVRQNPFCRPAVTNNSDYLLEANLDKDALKAEDEERFSATPSDTLDYTLYPPRLAKHEVGWDAERNWYALRTGLQLWTPRWQHHQKERFLLILP